MKTNSKQNWVLSNNASHPNTDSREYWCPILGFCQEEKETRGPRRVRRWGREIWWICYFRGRRGVFFQIRDEKERRDFD